MLPSPPLLHAYLGLRVGLTVATSIPIAVLTVAFFRLLGKSSGNLVAGKSRWPKAGWSQFLTHWHFADGNFTWVEGRLAVILGVALVLAVSAFLYRAGSEAQPAPPDAAGNP